MLSRAQRRYREKTKKNAAEVIEEKKKSSPWLYAGSVVILIIIVVTFVATPTVSKSGGGAGGGPSFGSYAGHKISYTSGGYFANQRQTLGEEAQSSGEATDNPSVYYQIWRQAFQQTLLHTAILVAAETGGLYVSDDAVDNALIDYGPYQEDGEFSEARFERASTADKYATRALYREQLIHTQYLQDSVYGVLTSKAEAAKLATMASPERCFDLVSFAFTTYPQDKVEEYGRTNAAKFSRIKLSRILIKSGKKEAESIASRLQQDPLRFEEIAKASSKDSYAAGGGSMGWQYRYQLEGDFETAEPVDTVLALKQGEVSAPLEGKYGWAIFRCDEAAINIDMSVEEDRQTVRTYIDRYAAGLVQDYTLEIAKSFVSRARVDGFAKIAQSDGLAVQQTTYFPMNYQSVFMLKSVTTENTPSGEESVISDAVQNEDFFKAAFTVREGEITEPVVLGKAVVVLSLRGEREAPAEDIDFMDDYSSYLAQQALATDLQTELMDETKIVDKFDETYAKYVAPSATSSGS